MRRIFLILVALAFANATRAANHSEPQYHGKTLTQWSHALDEPNAEIRARAAGAIAQMGIAARSAAPLLGRLLSDPDPRVQLEAARALNAMGPAARPAVTALSAALLDPSNELRSRAATALGQIGPESCAGDSESREAGGGG